MWNMPKKIEFRRVCLTSIEQSICHGCKGVDYCCWNHWWNCFDFGVVQSSGQNPVSLVLTIVFSIRVLMSPSARPLTIIWILLHFSTNQQICAWRVTFSPNSCPPVTFHQPRKIKYSTEKKHLKQSQIKPELIRKIDWEGAIKRMSSNL